MHWIINSIPTILIGTSVILLAIDSIIRKKKFDKEIKSIKDRLDRIEQRLSQNSN